MPATAFQTPAHKCQGCGIGAAPGDSALKLVREYGEMSEIDEDGRQKTEDR